VTSRQVDLDEAIAASAGLVLAPDWLLARARRTRDVEPVDATRLGLSLRPGRHEYVAASMAELRLAAGVARRFARAPTPGEGPAHAHPEDPRCI